MNGWLVNGCMNEGMRKVIVVVGGGGMRDVRVV